MAKEFTVTRTDLGVIITCSVCFGFSYSQIPAWDGPFVDLLLNYFIPFIIGILGYTYILLQKPDNTGKIILGIATILSFGFGAWFIIKTITNLGDVEGYYIFVLIVKMFYYGFSYISPGIACGWRAYEIHTGSQGNSINVDLFSFASLIACSLLISFFWNEFFISVIVFKMNGNFVEVFYAILTIISLPMLAAGLYGNIKNHKIALAVFCAFSLLQWLWYLIFFEFQDSLFHLDNKFEGFWKFINSVVFILANAYKAFLIHDNKQPTADYDALL